ncbi:hypothetical protein DRO02_01215 [archaeon]|nr:MAG: hypothetical protein DRO02_01215 [archaeon]RLG66008.1 MAG: hypothetical protein DRO21_00425 [archaeon]HDM23986.1 methyltransferase domain-containing protein [Candidatus Bathyarchaeota archaeon]
MRKHRVLGDHFYKRAKKLGYLSRAAFKLEDIQRKFRVIRKGVTVLDLGAAPGGWTQVSLGYVGKHGKVISVDLSPVKVDAPNLVKIQADITSPETIEKIKKHAEKVDVVLSDAAPHLSGIWEYDIVKHMELAEAAYNIACKLLSPGGNIVIKLFEGGEEVQAFITKVRRRFRRVSIYRTKATRKHSREMYLIGIGYSP